MKNTKINFADYNRDIFYSHIYPLYAKEFMFGSNYEEFAKLLSSNFIFNDIMWEYILDHWEHKESLKVVAE
jgi:hypothetical protein